MQGKTMTGTAKMREEPGSNDRVTNFPLKKNGTRDRNNVS